MQTQSALERHLPRDLATLVHDFFRPTSHWHYDVAFIGHGESCVGIDPDHGLWGTCAGGHLELAKLMISRGANRLNEALGYACAAGHMDLINLLIIHGANDFNSAMLDTCFCARAPKNVVRLLLAKGANNAHTCMIAICERKHNHDCDTAKILLAYGANDLNEYFSVACWVDNSRIMGLLSSVGATKCGCNKPIDSHILT